jgi:ketosteroid isomerase-like protein
MILLPRLFYFSAILICFFLAVTVSGATPEDRARTVIDQFNTAMKLKNAEAVSRLLADDCTVLMIEPSGATPARLFTRENYLKLLKDRFSETAETIYNGTTRSVSLSQSGDVFVTADSDVRARVGQRSEWFRSHEYIVMRAVGETMTIRLVVAELVFYFPDVPPDPEAGSKNGK